ncbi:hypothetical protein ACA910_006056 [Epithemia clementina (nom. ined.)]
MEEETGVGIGNKGQDGAIGRTQSSLELLSNTALGVAKEGSGTSATTSNRAEEQEESFSAGSGDTSESARVTPSLSQGSMAAAAASAASGAGPSGGINESGVGGDPRSQQLQQEGSQTAAPSGIPSMKNPGMVSMAPQGFIPTSPYYPHTPGGGMGGDPTGLPIDHYTTTSGFLPAPQGAPPPHLQQPSFLPPESYYAQPHYYSTGGGGMAHAPANLITLAPPQSGAPPTPPPQFANLASKRGGLSSTTHAAFIPPRSSSIRMSSCSLDGPSSPTPSPYSSYMLRHGAYPPIPALNHSHPPQQQLQEQQQPPPHHRIVNFAAGVNTEQSHHAAGVRPSARLDACESFQSDSTASLVSEKMNQQQRQMNKLEKQVRSQASAGKDSKDSYAGLMTENHVLRDRNAALKQEIEKRDQEIAVLRGEVRDLDLKVKELRQFPAGKISQIPMADMLEIMQIYGSEVSDTVMPPRKMNIQKASVIRQFRRWNPNFLKYFYFKDGKWHPKLGKEAELERRKTTRKKGLKPKSYSDSPLPPEELSPQEGHKDHQEDSKLGESSENEDTDPSLWTIHNAHTSTTTTNANSTHTTSATPESPSILSLSPGENRKRKFEDDSNNKKSG